LAKEQKISPAVALHNYTVTIVKGIHNKQIFMAPKTVKNGEDFNLFAGGMMDVSVIMDAFWCQVLRG